MRKINNFQFNNKKGREKFKDKNWNKKKKK